MASIFSLFLEVALKRVEICRLAYGHYSSLIESIIQCLYILVKSSFYLINLSLFFCLVNRLVDFHSSELLSGLIKLFERMKTRKREVKNFMAFFLTDLMNRSFSLTLKNSAADSNIGQQPTEKTQQDFRSLKSLHESFLFRVFDLMEEEQLELVISLLLDEVKLYFKSLYTKYSEDYQFRQIKKSKFQLAENLNGAVKE
jgi:hypothetical protein